MGDRHDYVALEWVKGEIAETLKQARHALEAFVENPQDSTRMRFCLTYVHQVHGTLQMVEFYGAALLAEEMEQLSQALMEGRVTNQGEALEVLMQAILQLPVYLDRIQSARRDLPMVVLPLLNDLRAARGEKLLSETSLFSPDMSGRTPALSVESLAQLRTAELPVLLRKLRQMLQMALVGVIRNQDLGTNLGYMARVFARLETLCKEAPLGPLWQIASGMVEGLANGSVVNGTSVRTLLRQVDKELKRLVEQGADGINQPAPDDLAKNLLFYVAKSSAESPRIRVLKEQYRLAEALPDADVVDEERARLAGPDRDAMRSVVAALCEELVRVKDSLDLFVRSDRQKVSELDSLLAPLKQIADTLAVLGFGQPRKVIVDQIDVVHSLSLGQREVNDAVLMDVAGALLYVEATLAGMVGQADDRGREESHLPTTDVAQIHQLVIKEARNGLEQAKDAIIEFIASQWNHEHLARVPELLTQVRGGLAMIPLPRAAALLNACNRYIQEQLLARKAVPNWHNLDTLADAITSVEYYLERLAEDHATQGDLILDVAEESLETLGYPLQEKPSILDRVEPVEESIAPLANPMDDIEVLSDEPVEPSLVAEALDAAELPPVDSPADGLDNWTFEAPASEPAELDLATPSSNLAVDATPESVPFDEELSGEFASLADTAETTPATVSFSPDREWDLSAPQELSVDAADFSFDLSTPLEPESLAPAPEAVPVAELPSLDEELAFDALDSDSPAQWGEAELAGMDLPEVELPSPPVAPEVVPAPEKPLSLADVMAAPVQAINPPAHDVPPSLLPPPADEEPVDEELLEVFIEEVGEVLETIGVFLPQWRSNTENKDALIEVRRAFHTLKGSGRMVRALIIGELGWSIENLLNRVLDRSILPGDEVQQVIVDVVALMPALVDEFAAKAQRQRNDVDCLAATAHALARGEELPKFNAPAQEQAAASVGEPVAAPVVQAIAVPDEEALDPQLLEIFRNEAETHLDTLVGFLADCAQTLPQPVTDDLQRALHTLKGSAYMAGILPIAEIAAPLEKLAKEFKANLVDMDLAEAELLHTAEQLFRVGVEQLETQPLAPIPGTLEFFERVQQLHFDRLEAADAARQGDSGESRDPHLISIFLAEGMDILLDAEDLLKRWREHPSERQELSALLDELTTLGRGAEMAELPQIDELCQALLSLYGAVQDGRLAVSQRFFEEAESAHEALISMMDQVAAGLQVSAQPNQVAAVLALLDEAFNPAMLALLEPAASAAVQVVELDAPSAEQQWNELAGAATSEPETVEPSPVEPSPVLVSEPWPDAPVEDAEEAVVHEALDEEMVEIFLEEAVDILESAGQALDRWLGEPDNNRALLSLQRDLHTLKGGARMAEIKPIGDLAHELESVYEGLVDRRYSYSPALTGLLHQSHDRLATLLDQLQARQPMRAPTDLIKAILAFRHGDTSSFLSQPSSVEIDDLSTSAAVDAGEPLADRAWDDAQVQALPTLDLDEEPLNLDAPGVPAAESVELAPLQWDEPLSEALPTLDLDEQPLNLDAPGVPAAEPVELAPMQWDEPLSDALPTPDLDGDTPSLDAPTEPVTESVELAPLQWDEPLPEALPTLDLDGETPSLDAPSVPEVESVELAPVQWDEPLPEALPTLDLDAVDAAAILDSPPEIADEPAVELEAVQWNDPEPRLAPPSLSLIDEPDEPESLALSPNALDDERDPELVEIFLEEGFDIIDSSTAALQRWMSDTNNTLEVESLQRDLHTLKGGARMAEIREIGDLAHELEFLYEGLGDGRLRASPVLFDLLQRCHDRLAQMLEAVRDKRGAPSGDALIETIKRFRANPDEQLSIPSSVALKAAPAPQSADVDAEEDILEIFLEEGDDLLEAMEAAIGRWEGNRTDAAAVDDMLRILHTLKGGARLAGQKRLGDLTHDLEQHLAEAQQQGAPWPDSLFVDVQSGFEALQGELDQLRVRLNEVLAVDAAEPRELPVELPPEPVVPVSSRLLSPIVAASEVPTTALVAKVLPFVRRAEEAALEAASRRAPQELVKVPAELLEGLVNLAGETSIFRGRVEQQVSDFGFTLGEMEATIDRVRDQLRRLDIETQSQILSRYQAEAERAGYEDFDPLEMDRHSQLQQLSRSLFESASDLLDLKETLTARNRDAETLLLQQARVNTELQEGLMRTRMVPFERMLPRLKRIVRQVSSELGKDVEFIVGNAEGEMDRNVLERMAAPLEHMLRNAVDHGLESTEARIAAGKPAQGTITLDLSREGGDIIFDIRDDGAGVPLDAVRRKAIKRGLLAPDSDISDRDVLQFILQPGFSTAEKITQISGRGVGMDVVHEEVRQLGGSMSIDSVPGQGVHFRIRLPFTVSVNRALMVQCLDEQYAIPLNTIDGIVRVLPNELEGHYQLDPPAYQYAG
ncbi:MAG: Hpt domain-containing protein, partial [Pseudomonas sp.]|uniref:Hpt domain-containing protein n=1 Tax=Pseudomonas sp. TaxID=306 RepID=UPI0033935F33